jgi:hypothetical protein
MKRERVYDVRMSDSQTATPEVSNIGSQLVAQRRRAVGECAVCGKEIAGYVLKRFCSGACQVKDYRRRRREERERAAG